MIFSHFSQFGEVIEAGIARNYHGTLHNYIKEAELNKKVLEESKRIELDPKRGESKKALI